MRNKHINSIKSNKLFKDLKKKTSFFHSIFQSIRKFFLLNIQLHYVTLINFEKIMIN